MIPATNNQQHRSEHGWGGGTPLAALCRAHTSAAHDKAQSGAQPRPVCVTGSDLLAGLMQFLPVRTGGGLNRSRLFSNSHAAHEGHIGALSFRLRSLYDGGGYGRLLTSEKLAIDNLSAPEQAGEPTPTPITTSENTKAGRAE